MKLITKTLLPVLVLHTAAVLAEPVTVPHTFSPNTPAKASEVNANMQALADAIKNIKNVNLYQNNVKIGSSVLANLIKLNSGYLVVASKKKGATNIYLKSGMDALYYTSNNCSGTTYAAKGLTEDLLVGEVGAIGAFRDQAYYMNTPATPVNNLYVNSLKEDDGICINVSQYVLTTNAACDLTHDAGGNPIPLRGNLITYLLAGPSCNIWTQAGQKQSGDTMTVCQQYDDDNSWQLNQISSQCPGSTIQSGTVLPQLDIDLDNIGKLPEAYAVLPNNPAVTGITTSACTNLKGKPAVCIANAQLKNE